MRPRSGSSLHERQKRLLRVLCLYRDDSTTEEISVAHVHETHFEVELPSSEIAHVNKKLVLAGMNVFYIDCSGTMFEAPDEPEALKIEAAILKYIAPFRDRP